VRLSNGRTLEGVVERETPDAVVLNVGVGTVTLRRAQIRSVERSGAAGDDAVRQAWREKYFAHEKYAPRGLERLAADFRALEAARTQAIRAGDALVGLRRDRERLLKDLEQAHAGSVEAARRLQASASPLQTDDYNRLVGESNAWVSRMTVLRDALDRNARATDGCRNTVRGYHAVLAAVRAALAEAEGAGAVRDEAAVRFLSRLRAETDALLGDFVEVAVPVERDSHHAYAAAHVNGAAVLNLVVDTGATYLTLTRAAAARLGLNPPGEPHVRLTQADGTAVKARPVTLHSVDVGGARLERVAAVVLPSDLPDGCDGLLGMSFLREFEVRLDAERGSVVLERFDPR
jgi:clan AA aspartic protease (TIGR02281 family)